MAGKIVVGATSWTEPTLIKSGKFYPPGATAEGRLRFYAQQFPVVEVDSTFYAIPDERTAWLWAERTPPGFIFDAKAYGALTHHPTPVLRLPADLRAKVTAKKERARVYLRDLEPSAVTALWQRFYQALLPLQRTGKLGVVLFQFPKWFFPGRDTRAYLAQLRERLPGFRVAVEFRQRLWMDDSSQERTLDFLREQGLVYTCVDEPQGMQSSVPPVAAATGDLALIRFHGRNVANWERPGTSVIEKFDYLYTRDELAEWVPKVRELARHTQAVHALMNNCHRDYAVQNARDLADLLD